LKAGFIVVFFKGLIDWAAVRNKYIFCTTISW